MNIEIEKIITEQINHNANSNSIHKNNSLNKFKETTSIDWKLSYFIDKFLSGKINTLPPMEFIKELIDSSYNDIISMGYGYTINKDLTITHFEPITPKTERIDIISPDNYQAYISGSPELIKNNEPCYSTTLSNYSKYESIDPEQFPIFDKKRLFILKTYLDKYNNKYNITKKYIK